MTQTDGKKTALFAQHEALGARIVPFAGYRMPLTYAGQLEEHRTVRTGVGLFDLSHMGELRLRGRGAEEAADRLVTNRFAGVDKGQAVYAPMCREDGGIVDDLILYRLEDSVLLVVNASNIAKDAAWIAEHLPAGVTLVDESDDTALVAVQGPRTLEVLGPLASVPIAPMETYTALEGSVAGIPALISRTGYTGEDGFELYVTASRVGALWERLYEAGKPQLLAPIGLAARDTLRFEMGYCLYGNDIDDTTTPLEAGLGWTVKLDKGDFVGKERLAKQKMDGVKQRLVGFAPEGDRKIPRAGQTLHDGAEVVGRVTSGTFSPSLDRGLGMGYVETSRAKEGSRIEVDIRGRRESAVVRRFPFYASGSRKAPGKQARP